MQSHPTPPQNGWHIGTSAHRSFPKTSLKALHKRARVSGVTQLDLSGLPAARGYAPPETTVVETEMLVATGQLCMSPRSAEYVANFDAARKLVESVCVRSLARAEAHAKVSEARALALRATEAPQELQHAEEPHSWAQLPSLAQVPSMTTGRSLEEELESMIGDDAMSIDAGAVEHVGGIEITDSTEPTGVDVPAADTEVVHHQLWMQDPAQMERDADLTAEPEVKEEPQQSSASAGLSAGPSSSATFVEKGRVGDTTVEVMMQEATFREQDGADCDKAFRDNTDTVTDFRFKRWVCVVIQGMPGGEQVLRSFAESNDFQDRPFLIGMSSTSPEVVALYKCAESKRASSKKVNERIWIHVPITVTPEPRSITLLPALDLTQKQTSPTSKILHSISHTSP